MLKDALDCKKVGDNKPDLTVIKCNSNSKSNPDLDFIPFWTPENEKEEGELEAHILAYRMGRARLSVFPSEKSPTISR